MSLHTDADSDTIGISINQGHLTVNGDRIILQAIEVSKTTFTGCVSAHRGTVTRFVISKELSDEELKETVDRLKIIYNIMKSNSNLLTIKELQVPLPIPYKKIEDESEWLQYIIECFRRDFVRAITL